REESSITKNVFAVTAYPNPFADNVSIDIRTASAEKVNVKVYDMTGRLLEVLDTDVSEVNTLQIGDRYPSGVYNVIVSQGDEVKTLRVIKR
ncbi:MAG TPA: T9SS type A sorting domain-containing protein, partial [Flavobacterium sp.]|nr:T9SS type A sorting domain-containing protein [Flavobacterium sp.]